MKTILFVLGAPVENNKPGERLQTRLDAALEYCRDNPEEEHIFLVSGRWNNVTDEFLATESEIAKRYILSRMPNARVLKEDISVETGGNFAFSKPFVDYVKPDKVIVFNSKNAMERTKFLARKIFGPARRCEFMFPEDGHPQNNEAIDKQSKALAMFKKLLSDVADGDDAAAREILLYQTPFYFKGLKNEKEFFDKYWEGGFEDFLDKRRNVYGL